MLAKTLASEEACAREVVGFRRRSALTESQAHVTSEIPRDTTARVNEPISSTTPSADGAKQHQLPMLAHARSKSENDTTTFSALIPKPEQFQIRRQHSEPSCSASIPQSIDEESESADDLDISCDETTEGVTLTPHSTSVRSKHRWFTRTVSPYCDIDGLEE